MKRIVFLTALGSVLAAVLSITSVVSAATWKPVTPSGFSPITWAQAPGIATFFKAPTSNGTLDFITRIYLPQNEIGYVASSSAPLDWGLVNTVTDTDVQNTNFFETETSESELASSTGANTDDLSNYHNFAFTRLGAELAKQSASTTKFIWNAPYFNITNSISDLSLALKFTIGTTTIISRGSRPPADMAQPRRMLLVNNQTGRAQIKDFDGAAFVSSTLGDVALEGFSPTVAKNDNTSGATARLFLGVATSTKELIVYCSQQATVAEASAALLAAGVPVENQLQADGGGSASCGYNLPGQYFVEPTRTLPLMMGASTVLARGTITSDFANVRNGPTTKNKIVGKLFKGANVRAYEEKSGWYRIGAGQWVSKTLIKPMKM